MRNSNKWLSKLTKDELIELFRNIFGDYVDSIKTVDYEDGIVAVNVMEKGWESDEASEYLHITKDEPIETYYELEDYTGIHIYDWADTSNNGDYVTNFRQWMINKFGIEYINDLIQEVLGLNLSNYLNWGCTHESTLR